MAFWLVRMHDGQRSACHEQDYPSGFATEEDARGWANGTDGDLVRTIYYVEPDEEEEVGQYAILGSFSNRVHASFSSLEEAKAHMEQHFPDASDDKLFYLQGFCLVGTPIHREREMVAHTKWVEKPTE